MQLLHYLTAHSLLLLLLLHLVEEVERVELLSEQWYAAHHERHQRAVAVGAYLAFGDHAEGGVAQVRHWVDRLLDLPGVDGDGDRLGLAHYEVALLGAVLVAQVEQ